MTTETTHRSRPPAPARPELRQTGLLHQSLTMVRRNLRHIKRQPETLTDVTIQPVMFVLLFAFVFGGSIQTAGAPYREWLLPGIMAQTMAFASFVVAIGLNTDIDKGIVDRFRSLPISRASVLIGRSLSSLIHSSIGIVVMSLTGLAIGWRITGGLPEALLGFALLLLFGFAMIWIGILAGSALRSIEAVNGVMFTTIFPITFLANTFAPTEQMTPWLRTIAEWNPISSLVQALRELWGNTPPVPRGRGRCRCTTPMLFAAGWSVLIAVVDRPARPPGLQPPHERVGMYGQGPAAATLPPMASPSLSVTLDDVRAAQDLLSGVVRPTPLEYSRALADRVGAEVYLKCENLQRAGSFKIRGAYTRMARLSDEEKARGVVAASAGNHAQGVALAAQLLGIKAKVYMPHGAPMPKLVGDQGLRRRPSSRSGPPSTSAWSRRASGRPSTGAVLIHPFDHPTSSPGRAPAAWRSSRSAPTSGPSSSAPAAAGCWPGSPRRSRRSSPTCGSSACRPSRPPPTRCRWRPASRWRSRTCRPWPTASRSACPATCPTPWSATSSTAWRR